MHLGAYIVALVFLQLFHYSSQTDAKAQPSPTRTCPVAFNIFFHQYQMCALDDWNSGLQLGQKGTFTPQDLIHAMEAFCGRLDATRSCLLDQYQGCQPDLLTVLRAALDRSAWFCDPDTPGSVRTLVRTALMGSGVIAVAAGAGDVGDGDGAEAFNADGDDIDFIGGSPPVSSLVIPEQETLTSFCMDRRSGNGCVQSSMEEFSFIRDLPTPISIPIAELFANPQGVPFFRSVFECGFRSVSARCPHNALAMTFVDQSHFMFPPKFGINVTAFILEHAV